MKRSALFSLLLGIVLPAAAGDSHWVLEKCELAYHVDHPFHDTVGRSYASRGKGACTDNGCDFLVAAPVKSFDSGDSNRDLHMIQAVNGAQYPLITVRTHLAGDPANGSVKADLEVDFGGKSVTYKDVSFEISEASADRFRVKGNVPLVLTQHKVNRPSLLGVAVKDSAPVEVDALWRRP